LHENGCLTGRRPRCGWKACTQGSGPPKTNWTDSSTLRHIQLKSFELKERLYWPISIFWRSIPEARPVPSLDSPSHCLTSCYCSDYFPCMCNDRLASHERTFWRIFSGDFQERLRSVDLRPTLPNLYTYCLSTPFPLISRNLATLLTSCWLVMIVSFCSPMAEPMNMLKDWLSGEFSQNYEVGKTGIGIRAYYIRRLSSGALLLRYSCNLCSFGDPRLQVGIVESPWESWGPLHSLLHWYACIHTSHTPFSPVELFSGHGIASGVMMACAAQLLLEHDKCP